MRVLGKEPVEQHTGLEPVPSVWKTDVLTTNTNAAWMAGAAGLEPTHTGVKVPCLTAWLHPYVLVGFPLRLSRRRLPLYIQGTITLWRFPPTAQFSASVVILG